MKIYFFVHLGSAFIALVITPLVIWLARRHSIVSVPGNRHMHEKPISHIGGVSIFLSTIALTVPVMYLTSVFGVVFSEIRNEISIILCAASLIFIVGLVDDIRENGLSARAKFIAQTIAALSVCAFGIRINSIIITEQITLEFGWFSWPITLLWIVGLTNAVNLSDGLDGLASGISAIACGVIAILAIYFGYPAIAILMLSIVGSLTGFLFFNFNPAKIFMGDCGSMFLGFTIASASVLCSAKSSTFTSLALPFLALGIPIFDTLFSMLRRFLERRSIFSADKSHFHHRLIDRGYKQRLAVLIIYIITLLTSGLGMLMLFTQGIISMLIFFCILLILFHIFRIVGAVRFRETIIGFKNKYSLGQMVQEEIRNFEDAELHFRKAKDFEQWWQAVSAAADTLGFSNVNLPLTNRDGSSRQLIWSNGNSNFSNTEEDVLKLNLPVQDRRKGQKLSLRIEVYQKNCLESAGRRIALFTRLMNSYSVNCINSNGAK